MAHKSHFHSAHVCCVLRTHKSFISLYNFMIEYFMNPFDESQQIIFIRLVVCLFFIYSIFWRPLRPLNIHNAKFSPPELKAVFSLAKSTAPSHLPIGIRNEKTTKFLSYVCVECGCHFFLYTLEWPIDFRI